TDMDCIKNKYCKGYVSHVRSLEGGMDSSEEEENSEEDCTSDSEFLIAAIHGVHARTLMSEFDIDLQTTFAQCIVNIIIKHQAKELPMNIIAFHISRIQIGKRNRIFTSFSEILLQHINEFTNTTILE
ncbi:hypothetical protein L9F63_000710, partial [Diploptera punctata]